MAQVGMTIMLSPSAESQTEEVVKSIENAGVEIQERLPHLGTLIGVGDESKIQAVMSISGVEHVRSEARFELPPMDESIPQ